jgi:hypothetical protein
MIPQRYSVERSPIGRGRYLYEVMAEGFPIPVYTSRYPEAAHERKESLDREAAKMAADRRARNCDLPLEVTI